MPSARTECPTCSSADVVDLNHLVHSSSFDYFRCRSCNCYWMVRVNEDAVAHRLTLGRIGVSAARDLPTGSSLPLAHRICDKCHGRANLLESLSTFARVDYYRCAQCLHVWIQDIDPNAPRIDVTIRGEDEQAS